MKTIGVSASLLCAFYSIGALAVPIGSDNNIEIFQVSNVSSDNFFSQNSNEATFRNTVAPGVEAFGNLTTGKVGAISANSTDKFDSIATMRDTLTFDTAADVSISYTLDGFLSSTSRFQSASGQGRIDIYDITGVDDWLVEGDFFGIPQVDVSSEAESISGNRVNISMNGIDAFTQKDGRVQITNELSRDGTKHPVSFTIEDTFTVDPSKIYGISLTAGAFSSEDSVADFLNTGTFAFTDLGDSSFTSGSGLLLSAQQPVPVPEPGTLALLALGLAVLGHTRRKRIAQRRF